MKKRFKNKEIGGPSIPAAGVGVNGRSRPPQRLRYGLGIGVGCASDANPGSDTSD
jgi:hypothetical protein